jgi:lysozyme
MNDALHISGAGLNLIKQFEGCYLNAYYDAVHVLTIGYGHTNMDGVPPRVFVGQRITREQAEEILTRSLAVHYEPSVKRYVTVPLSQHEFDALVSFCYNCGEGNLKRLVRRLNKGDYNSIPAMLMQYTRAGGKVLRGLVRRRSAEAALWKSEPYQGHIDAHLEDRQTAKVDYVASPEDRDELTPVVPVMTGDVDRADELPDKIAKWGAATSPFSIIMAYITDWKVLAVLFAALLLAAAGYAFWRWKTK